MTTTIDLKTLPHWEEFKFLYDKLLCPGKAATKEKRSTSRGEFWLLYWRLYQRYGDDKSSFEYLELMFQDEPELLEELLAEAKTLLPGVAPSVPEDTSEPEAGNTPKKTLVERFKRRVEPKDTDGHTADTKKEVTS